MTKFFIGTVRYSAPLFNKATLKELLAIVNLLSDASYHYADDSGGEWGNGRHAMESAATKCVQLRFSYDALELLYKDTPQLVTFSQFMDHVLRASRETRL